MEWIRSKIRPCSPAAQGPHGRINGGIRADYRHGDCDHWRTGAATLSDGFEDMFTDVKLKWKTLRPIPESSERRSSHYVLARLPRRSLPLGEGAEATGLCAIGTNGRPRWRT